MANNKFHEAASKLDEAVQSLRTARANEIDAALRLVEDAADAIRLGKELDRRDNFLYEREVALRELERRYSSDY